MRQLRLLTPSFFQVYTDNHFLPHVKKCKIEDEKSVRKWANFRYWTTGTQCIVSLLQRGLAKGSANNRQKGKGTTRETDDLQQPTTDRAMTEGQQHDCTDELVQWCTVDWLRGQIQPQIKNSTLTGRW